MKTTVESSKEWIETRIKRDEITKYTGGGPDFIPDAEIIETIKQHARPDEARVRDILAKSLAIETLTPDETAALLNVTNPALLEEMRQTAFEIKKKVYDNRIVTFAPLYLSNQCVNSCLYCGFRCENASAERRTLSMDDIQKEIEILAGKIGHKRLIVVYGEHEECNVDYMVESIKKIYSVKMNVRKGNGNIRRINVNAPPMSIDELKRIQAVGIGTYQVFQETYHHDTYRRMHPGKTIKGDYQWRLYSMHRAFEAGIDDVGIGALFGLYDWKFEVMGLLYHAREMEKCFGVGPHTVSFPRLEPASNAPVTSDSTYAVTDNEFLRLVTILRLSIPHTGMIVTARENPEIRRETLAYGITQTDASTCIGIGSYSQNNTTQKAEQQQFEIGDTRSLDEVVRELAKMGYITSFCTAGYRCGRTGECIMELLKTGHEGKFCKLNAVLTYKEWLDDFASEETKQAAEPVMQKEIQEIKEKLPLVYPVFIEYLERITNGERDLYF